MLDATTADLPADFSYDAECLAVGDEYIRLAVRCYAGALLSDRAIRRRLLDFAGPDPDPPPFLHDSAAVAFARHCAWAGVPIRQIVVWLARLAVDVPGWPDEPKHIAAIARAAVREVAQ